MMSAHPLMVALDRRMHCLASQTLSWASHPSSKNGFEKCDRPGQMPAFVDASSIFVIELGNSSFL